MSELIQQIEADGFAESVSPTKGEVIYHQGDAAEHLVVVKRGIVYLSIRESSGKQTVSEIVKAGHWFGYEPLEDLVYYQSSATALTETTISRIAASSINKALMSYPDLKDQVEGSRARSRRLVTQRMVDLNTKSTNELLAGLILDLDEGGKIGGLSHQDLSALINRTRERISLVMGRLRAEGVIAGGIHVSPITIVDRDRLESIAQRERS